MFVRTVMSDVNSCFNRAVHCSPSRGPARTDNSGIFSTTLIVPRSSGMEASATSSSGTAGAAAAAAGSADMLTVAEGENEKERETSKNDKSMKRETKGGQRCRRQQELTDGDKIDQQDVGALGTATKILRTKCATVMFLAAAATRDCASSFPRSTRMVDVNEGTAVQTPLEVHTCPLLSIPAHYLAPSPHSFHSFSKFDVSMFALPPARRVRFRTCASALPTTPKHTAHCSAPRSVVSRVEVHALVKSFRCVARRCPVRFRRSVLICCMAHAASR